MKKHELDEDSELGKEVKEVKLGWFTTLANVALREAGEDKLETLYGMACDLSSEIVGMLNDIEGSGERPALSAMVVMNLASSLYLTIDQALAELAIEKTFGGGDE